MESKFSKVKVNNEVELCKVTDEKVKGLVEKALLSERISYFIKWEKGGFFSDRQPSFIFCINEWQVEAAENAITALGNEATAKIKYVKRKTDKFLF